MMFGGGSWDWPVFHGPGGILIVFSTLIVAGVIFAYIRRARRSGGGGDRALDILRERYARGDLTTEQFEQMKQELE
jgi:putative membrane protein